MGSSDMEERPKKLLILYATQTGNALDVAERVGREAERRGCPVHLISIDQYDTVSFPLHSFLFSLFFVLVNNNNT